MSDSETVELTPGLVEQYLRDNPDFFSHRPELVDRLTLPRAEDGAVSLVHLQLNRQRRRIEELEEEITTLMSLAASNDRTFHAFMDLQGNMLKKESLIGVFNAVETTASQLGLRAYVRFVFAPESDYQVEELNWQRFSTNYFNGKEAFLGRLKKQDRNALLGESSHAPEFGSYAVLPLSTKLGQGVLAFSSEDGGHFQPCMDTLFLRHLSAVLMHLVNTLPWREEFHESRIG